MADKIRHHLLSTDLLYSSSPSWFKSVFRNCFGKFQEKKPQHGTCTSRSFAFLLLGLHLQPICTWSLPTDRILRKAGLPCLSYIGELRRLLRPPNAGTSVQRGHIADKDERADNATSRSNTGDNSNSTGISNDNVTTSSNSTTTIIGNTTKTGRFARPW